MVKLAMLVALLAIFCFTPLGFLKIGIVEITFNMIPVIIGAIAVGPAAGAVLGALFGAASFWQCFGQSTFGTLLFGVNPFYTALICFVPRILAGLLPGLIFRAMTAKKDNVAAYFVSAAVGSLTNTVLFVGGYLANCRADTGSGKCRMQVSSSGYYGRPFCAEYQLWPWICKDAASP